MDPDRGIEPREPVDQRQRVDRRRDVPAGHEQTLDAGQPGAADDELDVRREAVGLEVAVGVDQAHGGSELEPSAPVSRGRRPRLEPREERLGRGQPPGLAARGRPSELVEQRRPAVAVVARTDRRSRAGRGPAAPIPGMNGAAARATSRHASMRSPRTSPSRSAAAASPALAALARTHGCSASTVLFAPPTKSHSVGQRVVEQAALEPLAVDRAGARPRRRRAAIGVAGAGSGRAPSR